MKKFTAIILALVLMFSLSAAAFAEGEINDENQGTTSVTLSVENTQITATVPLNIVGYVNLVTGVITFANTAKIINNSAYPVYVSSIKCATAGAWGLALNSDGVGNDTIVATIKAGTDALNHALITTPVQIDDVAWNMAAKNAEDTTDEVALTLQGTVYNLTNTSYSLNTNDVEAFNITFTITAGSYVAP